MRRWHIWALLIVDWRIFLMVVVIGFSSLCS
jgi:hypothetical protein